MKKLFFVLLVFVVCHNTITAQIEKSTKIEVINGVEYYMHEIQKGQTFYGISKIYNVPVDTIIAYNPEAGTKLKIGSSIKIPTYKKRVAKNENIQTNNQNQKPAATPSQWHTVSQGESLFSISKKYNTTVDAIKKLNPGISESLSIGQRIEVPSTKSTDKNQSEVKSQVIPKDTVKKINEPNTQTEVKTEIKTLPKDTLIIKNSSPKNKIENDIYIALMVPLYTSQIQNINLGNIKSPTDISNTESFRFIQFYLGFLEGLKQYENKGISIHLSVYDVSDGVPAVKKIINEPNFSKTHLIVGPLFASTFIEVQKWADANGVYIVNPFTMQSNIVSKSPFSIKLTCEQNAKCKNLCNSIETQFPDANIILLHNKNSDTISIELLKQHFLKTKFKNSFKEVVFNEKGVNGIKENYKENRPNIILNFLNGEATITNYVRRLYELKLDSIYIFCPSDWLAFDNIETEYLQALNAHFYGDYFVDYRSDKTKEFVSDFIAQYGTEPTLDGYAFQGYDIASYFVGAMILYKDNWINKLPNYQANLISLTLNLNKSTFDSGLENKDLQIIKICNFELIPYSENCEMDLENRKY